MKTIFILCGLILVGGVILLWQYFRLPSHFGTFGGSPKVEVSDLVRRPQEFAHKTVTIEGVVRKQCTTMGCYFFFESGKDVLRIDISEIAMDAPRKNGHRARVEGQMVPYGDGFQFWASAVEFQ